MKTIVKDSYQNFYRVDVHWNGKESPPVLEGLQAVNGYNPILNCFWHAR